MDSREEEKLELYDENDSVFVNYGNDSSLKNKMVDLRSKLLP
jgi:hypothetical protein